MEINPTPKSINDNKSIAIESNQSSEINLEYSDLTGKVFGCAGQFKHLIDYLYMRKSVI
jgi:hypothetical protein